MAERTYSFIINTNLHNVLKSIAKRERRTINNQVAVILENYLNEEWDKDALLANKRPRAKDKK